MTPTRGRMEAAIAALAAVIVLTIAAGAAWLLVTAPVHEDAASVPSVAGPGDPAGHADAIDASRHLARALVADDNLPGLSVAVAVDGAVVWSEAFGFDDIEARLPLTPGARFRLGALSKPLTAAAAALLHDRGHLDLDAPVQRYVAGYPRKPWTVTTRQLLGDVASVHRIRGDNNDAMPQQGCADLDEAVTLFAGEPLQFEPGTQHRYSIYGWVLVSAAIEGAAGERFDRFMAREVFGALGLDHTVASENDGLDEVAAFHAPRVLLRGKLGLTGASRPEYSCLAGAGAFVSTPVDLARFGSAVTRPGVLHANTVAAFQSPARLASGATTTYALGWTVGSVEISGRRMRMLSHRGSPMGAAVSLVIFPDLRVAASAAANVSHAPGVDTFAREVAALFAR